MRHAVVCLLVQGWPPQHVLLAYKKRGFGVNKIVGIGGGIEAGETPESAALREIYEEIAVAVPDHALESAGVITFLFPNQPLWNHYVHIFLVNEWSGEPAESDEVSPRWFPVDTMPFDRMWSDSQHWLPLVLAGQHIEAQFIFAHDNETLSSIEIQSQRRDRSVS